MPWGLKWPPAGEETRGSHPGLLGPAPGTKTSSGHLRRCLDNTSMKAYSDVCVCVHACRSCSSAQDTTKQLSQNKASVMSSRRSSRLVAALTPVNLTNLSPPAETGWFTPSHTWSQVVGWVRPLLLLSPITALKYSPHSHCESLSGDLRCEEHMVESDHTTLIFLCGLKLQASRKSFWPAEEKNWCHL